MLLFGSVRAAVVIVRGESHQLKSVGWAGSCMKFDQNREELISGGRGAMGAEDRMTVDTEQTPSVLLLPGSGSKGERRRG